MKSTTIKQETTVNNLEKKGYKIDKISAPIFETIVFMSKRTKGGAEFIEVDEDGETH